MDFNKWREEDESDDEAGGGKALEQEELSKITIPNYASAFAQGAERVFKLSRGHSSGQVLETYLLMARTIGDFTTATRIADNLVQFDMPDESTVFAIWDCGTLPIEATGEVKAITYKGAETNLDASAVIAEVPTLVVMESGVGPSGSVRYATEFQGAQQQFVIGRQQQQNFGQPQPSQAQQPQTPLPQQV